MQILAAAGGPWRRIVVVAGLAAAGWGGVLGEVCWQVVPAAGWGGAEGEMCWQVLAAAGLAAAGWQSS